MTDEELRGAWREQRESHERVRWARMFWQLRTTNAVGTPTDAARLLGMKAGTYRPYERAPGASKFTPINLSNAVRFGKKFKVNWRWLLTGEGSPFEDKLPEAQERVLAAMELLTVKQQNALAEMVESMTGQQPSEIDRFEKIMIPDKEQAVSEISARATSKT